MAKEVSGEFDQSVLLLLQRTLLSYTFSIKWNQEEVASKMALIREYAEFSRIYGSIKEYGEVII